MSLSLRQIPFPQSMLFTSQKVGVGEAVGEGEGEGGRERNDEDIAVEGVWVEGVSRVCDGERVVGREGVTDGTTIVGWTSVVSGVIFSVRSKL